MPFTKEKIIKSLKKKGFRHERDSDHEFYFLYINDKKTIINTHVSFGNNQVDDDLCSVMGRQIKISLRQFKDLINCPLSRDKYIQILEEKNII